MLSENVKTSTRRNTGQRTRVRVATTAATAATAGRAFGSGERTMMLNRMQANTAMTSVAADRRPHGHLFKQVTGKWVRLALCFFGLQVVLAKKGRDRIVTGARRLPDATKAAQNELAPARLKKRSAAYRGTGGTSAEARPEGFVPAFIDRDASQVYRSCFADGSPCPVHLLEGLPADLVARRDDAGHVQAVKSSVVAGFLRDGRFYTREQTARIVSEDQE